MDSNIIIAIAVTAIVSGTLCWYGGYKFAEYFFRAAARDLGSKYTLKERATNDPDARDVFVSTLASGMILFEEKQKSMTIGQLADWMLGAMKHKGYIICK